MQAAKRLFPWLHTLFAVSRLVVLIKNINTLYGRKHFLLPDSYFPKNLVYPYTLRVAGIQIIRRPLT